MTQIITSGIAPSILPMIPLTIIKGKKAAMVVNAADASEALVRSDSIQLRSKVQPAADPAGSNHRTFLGLCATVFTRIEME